MVIAHIARLKVKLLLTDEAMAEVQGDKDRCLAVIHGFGGCGGCSANCGKVAKAQLKKVVEWGGESCPHTKNFPDTVDRPMPELMKWKRYCPQCWQSLSDEVKGVRVCNG